MSTPLRRTGSSAGSSAAGRIGYAITGTFMGDKLADVMANAAYYFKLAAPDWCPQLFQQLFVAEMNLYGFPQAYLPGEDAALSYFLDTDARQRFHEVEGAPDEIKRNAAVQEAYLGE